MSQLIPAAPRAPQTTAVQAASRPAAPRSGDDFARAMRHETDRSRPETQPSERPAGGDVRDAGRSGATTASSSTGSTDSTGSQETAPAQPVTAPVPGEAVAVPVLSVLPTGLLGLAGVPAETGATVVGTAAPQGTMPVAADTSGSPAPVQGHGLLGAPVALAAAGTAPAAGSAVAAEPAALAAPGRLVTDAVPKHAGVDQAAPALSGRIGEAAPVAPVPAAAVPAPAAPAVPAGPPVVDTAPATTPVAVAAPGASGSEPGSGGATDGGAGGSSGVPVRDGAAGSAGPTATSLGFAQVVTGLSGVERTPASAATASTGHASLAEQVRGPVLALRTAAPGEHVLTLKVTPDNLGPVQVRAHIGADGIRIELVGATDAARDGLRGLLTDLRRDLAGTGMNASLTLGADSGTGGRSGQGATDPGWTGDGSGRARPGPAAGAPAARDPHTAQAVPVTPTSSGAHGVDILT